MAGGIRKFTVQESQNLGLGQGGVAYTSDTNTYTPPSNTVVVAITFIEDTVFASGTTVESGEFTSQSSAGPGTNGDAFGSDIFPAGVTIFGRFTAVDLTSGAAVLYLGS
jgi:hypothetical protein|tara:strand:- start:6527 stop:6853 length:327 start_codon:yes stop_codon:yes gene_type:complete